MIIGVLKEIKKQEFRVGLTPHGALALTSLGHQVWVQKGAGLGSGFSDKSYQRAGARISPSASSIFSKAELLIKVKEPQTSEVPFFKRGQTLFTYLHLAALPELTRSLLQTGVRAIAYETVTLPDGSLPLLKPMSEVAGQLAVQMGAYALLKNHGGVGLLLGGTQNTQPAQVLIIGGGVVGQNALKVALGLGARVVVLDQYEPTLKALKNKFGPSVQARLSTLREIKAQLKKADLVVGAVLVPGKSAPKIITRKMIQTMKKGSVLVDVSIDQGGLSETSRPTTYEKPFYQIHGVIHCCVSNLPGAVAKTSTQALTQATLPFIKKLAKGIKPALQKDSSLAKGVNIWEGKITHRGVAESLGLALFSLQDILKGLP